MSLHHPQRALGTLLIFLKAPVPGKVKTRLAKGIGARAAAEAYCWMARRIRSEVELLRNIQIVWVYDPAPEFPDLEWLGGSHLKSPLISPLPLRERINVRGERYSESLLIWKQASGGLGNRLRLSISRAFREYGGSVCAIGTDSPGLRAARLRTAFNALRRHEVVLGPTEDGGYYLIGMRRFYPGLLSGIPWSSDRVLTRTLARARARGLRTGILPREMDVDNARDWKKVLSSLPVRARGGKRRDRAADRRSHARRQVPD